jgi:Zinc-binding dehydrogenase
MTACVPLPHRRLRAPRDGAFAEYTTARPDKVAPKPENLTFEQAATVPTSGCTALQAVRNNGNVLLGQNVLIIGAAGGVGSFAVQIAKAFGAHVTGVCSTKVDLVRSIGADTVIDYTRHDFAETGQRYDIILDIAGNRSVSHLRRALGPRGTLVIVGGEGGGRWFGGTCTGDHHRGYDIGGPHFDIYGTATPAARRRCPAAGRASGSLRRPPPCGLLNSRPRCDDADRVAGLPRGIVTFVFTDVDRSTELVKRLQERYGPVLAEHRALIRDAFAMHGGAEVDTQGDSSTELRGPRHGG